MKKLESYSLWNLFQMMSEQGLTPNRVYVLLNIQKNTALPGVNIHQEVRGLILTEFLDSEGKISEKGLQAISEIESFLDKDPSMIDPCADAALVALQVEKYLNIWPDIKLPSGKRARVNAGNLKGAFVWFFRNYKYDWETVLKATERYVFEYEDKNWMYCRNSQYFLRKQLSDKSWESELANYCAIVKSGNKSDDSFKFPENVV